MPQILNPAPLRRSLWIPWTFVIFLATVVGVNGVLVWKAVSTFTGLTVSHAYDNGRAFNEILAVREAQRALGWQGRVHLAEGRLLLELKDAAGRPVPARVEGRLQRPIEGDTVPLSLEAVAPGQYEAALPVLRPGQWEAQLVARDAEGHRYDLRQRMVLR